MDAARRAKLGQKWACFSCGTRFYDLNRGEPICPRCQTDQREKPKVEKTPKPRPTPKKAKRESKPAESSDPPPDPAEAAEEDADLVVDAEIDDPELDDLEIAGSDDLANKPPQDD